MDAERLAQIEALTGAELRREMRRFAAMGWSRPARADAHARKHAPEFAAFLRIEIDGEALTRIAAEVCAEPGRVLTGLTMAGEIEWHFIREHPGGAGIIVTVREPHLRTVFPARPLAGWFRRHRSAVEVTDRVRH